MKFLHVLPLMGLLVVLFLSSVLLVYASNIYIDESVMIKKAVYETVDGKLETSVNFLNDLVNSRDTLLIKYRSKNDSIKDILSDAIENPTSGVVSAINKMRRLVGNVNDSVRLSELINMADSKIRTQQYEIAAKLRPEQITAWKAFQKALSNHNAVHPPSEPAHGTEFGDKPREHESLVETKIFCLQQKACLNPPGEVHNPKAHRVNCGRKVEKTTFVLFKKKIDCKGYWWTCDDPTIPDVCPQRISHVSD